MKAVNDYREFIAGKRKYPEPSGFDVPESAINPMAFDWQRPVIRWALRSGRAALWEDCGLGKTLQQLEFANHVVHRTGKPFLILCPLAVSQQTKRESEKFKIDVDVRVCQSQADVRPGINITNYEKLHHFDTSAFVGVALDESSCLKSFTSTTKRKLCESFKHTPYKLPSTATPAPNDRMELGNHSEFLSIMPSDEMLERWFINDTMGAGCYRLRKHAERDFWDWMTCWAACISKPSDIGFSDEGYTLPGLNIVEHIVESDTAPSGMLFDTGTVVSATKVHSEKRRVLAERVDVVAKLVNESRESWAVWCDTDYESGALAKAIPDAVEVRGSHKESVKEERLSAFTNGQARVIITKSEIAGFGLNWQHCHNTTWFAGYSFEKFYQAIRRLYRFGQRNTLNCHVVMSDNEQSIAAVVKRKQSEHDEMYSEMARFMRDGMMQRIVGANKLRPYVAEVQAHLPSWLKRKGLS